MNPEEIIQIYTELTLLQKLINMYFIIHLIPSPIFTPDFNGKILHFPRGARTPLPNCSIPNCNAYDSFPLARFILMINVFSELVFYSAW